VLSVVTASCELRAASCKSVISCSNGFALQLITKGLQRFSPGFPGCGESAMRADSESQASPQAVRAASLALKNTSISFAALLPVYIPATPDCRKRVPMLVITSLVLASPASNALSWSTLVTWSGHERDLLKRRVSRLGATQPWSLVSEARAS